MLRKCKYCNKEFFGKEYFCSDLCEIKSHTPQDTRLKRDIIPIETKEELSEKPINYEIVEIKEDTITTGTELEISKAKSNKFITNQVF